MGCMEVAMRMGGHDISSRSSILGVILKFMRGREMLRSRQMEAYDNFYSKGYILDHDISRMTTVAFFSVELNII